MEFLMGAFPVIFEKVFDYTIGPVGRQIKYPIDYKKNVDNLRAQVKELVERSDIVQGRVEAATRNVEQIEGKVQGWLADVKEIMAKVGKFFEDEGQAKMKCCNGQCPNLKTRYQLSKGAYKLGLEVKEINGRGVFPTIGHRAAIQEIGTTIPTKGYEDFESRKSIAEGVMKALKDDDIRAIGVYGMGGTGKTMLVGKVARQAKEEKLFEEVVTIDVSQTPNLKEIQKDIAKGLGLTFKDEETDLEKALCLHKRLNQGKKILIIVDDIWKKLDLEALGISFEDDKQGCKILMTSRSSDVLRNDMGAIELFPVGVLLDNEAEDLFWKIVGDIVETSDFQSIAVEVIKECGGLPIAITAVGHALKNKKVLNVWKNALRQLKMAIPVDSKDKKVYKCIELSYNFLTEEEKKLFLFCSIFPDDAEIPIAFLCRLLVGLDFLEDVNTVEDVRNSVYTLVEELKASCLLLDGKKSGAVKMHDVVRDVAIYIADKDKQMLTIRRPDDLKNSSNPRIFKDSILIAPFGIESSQLPERLECPRVKLIALSSKDDSVQIPNLFFEGMKNLKVLVVIDGCVPKLPSSTCFHDNLQALHLIHCKLEDIAMIGELKNLKVLSLSRSSMRQLPKEIKQLTHLELLDLSNCSQLEWETEEQSMERRNARISDLDHLSKLTTLHIRIPSVKSFSKFSFLEKLERYEILIGNLDWDWAWDCRSEYEPEILRTLKLRFDRSFQLEVGIKKLLKSCECLSLAEMGGVDCIPDEDFPKLKYLVIGEYTEIQYISSWTGVQRVAFPLLESISLNYLMKLEKICHGQLAVGSFGNLRKLEVCRCPSLSFMFSSSVVGYVSKPQEIDITRCTGMSAIVAKESEEEIKINDITTNTMEFRQLRCICIDDLPSLMGFYSAVDSHSFFNEKVGFPKLEEIQIKSIDNLMMIWGNQLVPHSFCKLQKLIVYQCGNLKKVFPHNMLRVIQNLEELQISICGSVEEVFEIRGVNVEETIDTVASMLRELKLGNLPNLKHVWNPQANNLTFQNLREVNISLCRSLKCVFPISVAKSLSQLEKLIIERCGVEEFVSMEEESKTSMEFVLPKLTCLKLKDLPELKCFCPRKHTSKWPSLKKLEICRCPKLEIISSCDLSCQDTNGLNLHHVPIQQPFFLLGKDTFPYLEELWLDSYSAEPLAEFFRKLQVCELYDKFRWFSSVLAQRFCNLKTLHVRYSFVEEIYPHSMSDIRIFERMKELKLSEMPNLLHLWNENSQPGRTFENLYSLEVSKCGRLKNLLPSSISFQNLNDLRVSECHGLSYLVASSTAKSLVQLCYLEITECNRMKEIVTDEGEDEEEDEISFSRLRFLVLHCLPSLNGFNLNNHTIRFPKLRRVTVTGCPELKIFSNGFLSTPRLTMVELAEDNKKNQLGNYQPINSKALWEGDLNITLKRFWEDQLATSIQQLFIEKDTFPNLEELMMDCDCAEPLAEFFRKQHVCELFKYRGFSSALAQVLCNLKNLHVRHSFVGELYPYELFDKEGYLEGLRELDLSEMDYLLHLWNENSQPGSTFQNLVNLKVSKCGRLKNLVPSSISFQNLESLEVCECHGLSCLVTPSVAKSLVQLAHLKVSKCGRLKNLVPSSISFQNLKELEVCECHGLSCLVTSSVAKSLVQLTILVITECNKMTEIVRDEGGEEVEDEISFTQLEYLLLHCLPRLEGFNLSNHTIRFPLLKVVIVTGCPELKIFSNGVLSTPELTEVGLAENDERVQLGDYNGKMFWEGDLNTTIKRFLEDNFDTCIQQLFTEKAIESTSVDKEENVVDDLKNDSKQDSSEGGVEKCG